MSVERTAPMSVERVPAADVGGAEAIARGVRLAAETGAGAAGSELARGVGLTEALADLPSAVVVLFALLTQLGDPWFLFVMFAVLHWLGSRRLGLEPGRRTAILLGLGLAALAVTTGLKTLFGLPRPPGAATATPPVWLPSALDPVFRNFATGDSYAFPSGHAFGSTVAYGGLAALAERGTRWRRRFGAAAVVTVVCLSRLVLGVHYLVDVVAGVIAGLVFLRVALAVIDGRPRRAYGFAAVVSVLAVGTVVAVGSPAREAVAGLGAALGGFVVWYAVEERDRTVYATDVGLPAAVVGLVVTGGIWVTTYAVEPPLPVTLVANAATVGGVLALPTVIARMRKEESVVVESA